MRACSSGVSFGISRSGSSAGSPGGSEPSGSSRAARWPCMRIALTSAIAAATPPSSSVVGSGRRRRRGAGARALRRGRAAPRRRPRRPPRARGAARDPAALRERLRVALEEVAPLLRDGGGVVEVLLEEQRGVARVRSVDVGTSHVHFRCSSGRVATRARAREPPRSSSPKKRQTRADEHGRELEAALRAHPRRDERDTSAAGSGGAGATRARRGSRRSRSTRGSRRRSPPSASRARSWRSRLRRSTVGDPIGARARRARCARRRAPGRRAAAAAGGASGGEGGRSRRRLSGVTRTPAGPPLPRGSALIA